MNPVNEVEVRAYGFNGVFYLLNFLKYEINIYN